jgi:hypothetical protein
MRNRLAWALAGVLAVTVLGAVGLLFVRLRPYWVAKYRGNHADLRGTLLIHAPLADADLGGANLDGADLRGADLQGAVLLFADLTVADLRGADLRNAWVWVRLVHEGSTSKATNIYTRFTGARYDAHTRWPTGFHPHQHGAILTP